MIVYFFTGLSKNNNLICVFSILCVSFFSNFLKLFESHLFYFFYIFLFLKCSYASSFVLSFFISIFYILNVDLTIYLITIGYFYLIYAFVVTTLFLFLLLSLFFALFYFDIYSYWHRFECVFLSANRGILLFYVFT